MSWHSFTSKLDWSEIVPANILYASRVDPLLSTLIRILSDWNRIVFDQMVGVYEHKMDSLQQSKEWLQRLTSVVIPVVGGVFWGVFFKLKLCKSIVFALFPQLRGNIQSLNI